MKIVIILIVVAGAFCFGFLAARQPRVQPDATIPSVAVATNDNIALEEYASLLGYLSDTKQTNALKELNDSINDERAMQHGADLAVTVAILEGLRDGKTDAMLKFFENRLDTQIGLFGSGYRSLPVALQRQMSLKPLQQARDYRSKFPSTNLDLFSRQEVTNAFKILAEK